jgi:hypothetical protein
MYGENGKSLIFLFSFDSFDLITLSLSYLDIGMMLIDHYGNDVAVEYNTFDEIFSFLVIYYQWIYQQQH